MRKIKELLTNQTGNIMVLVAVAFTGLLGIAGLAIDGGIIYMEKAELEKVANAAALSGGQELITGEQNVRIIVDEVISKHEETSSLQSVDVTLTEPQKSVKVNLHKTVPLTFLNLFGIESVDIHADAKAGLGVMGRAVGAAPLGVDESLDLKYGETYPLKVGAGDSLTGNFGILALEGKGANDYEQTFRAGYQEELKLGDTILVQTGNIAGATREVVGEKVLSTCNENDRECARVILILVYSPVCGTLEPCTNYKEVKITGFAYFYITDPMDEKDTAITGKFIKRVGTGFESSSALENGAYTIKLLE